MQGIRQDHRPLTIFAIPKAFHHNIGIAQTNSIKSWLALRPQPRVILFGDDEGTAETAAALGCEHVPTIARSDHGTPLLSSIFSEAHARVSEGLMLFLNSDILLTSDIMPAISALPEDNFMLTGRRTCMYLRHAIDFADPQWEAALRQLADVHGTLWGPTALDYFVFPRSLFRKVPPFAVGRGWWDHWLYTEAERCGAEIIDATQSVLAIHQNHDFLAGEEAVRNVALFGHPTNSVSIRNANYEFRDGEIVKRKPLRQSRLLRAFFKAYLAPYRAYRRWAS